MLPTPKEGSCLPLWEGDNPYTVSHVWPQQHNNLPSFLHHHAIFGFSIFVYAISFSGMLFPFFPLYCLQPIPSTKTKQNNPPPQAWLTPPHPSIFILAGSSTELILISFLLQYRVRYPFWPLAEVTPWWGNKDPGNQLNGSGLERWGISPIALWRDPFPLSFLF